MAIKQFVRVDRKEIRKGDILGYWDLAPGDTAVPLICPRFNDKSVHMFGTWGGATVAMQISNDPDLVKYGAAYDPAGTTITQTADRAPWAILPNVFALKPVITAGSGSVVRVAVVGRGE